jgi:hypothetical protein
VASVLANKQQTQGRLPAELITITRQLKREERHDTQPQNRISNNMEDCSAYLFKMDAKLFFWELPPARKWQGKKLGEMCIVPYENGTKSQLVFMPNNKDSLKMNYCLDLAERHGGLRSIIHSALAIKMHDKDRTAIVFGKCASRSYIDAKGRAIRTAWCIRFTESWMANNFSFLLNRLVECNGNVRSFTDQ